MELVVLVGFLVLGLVVLMGCGASPGLAAWRV